MMKHLLLFLFLLGLCQPVNVAFAQSSSIECGAKPISGLWSNVRSEFNILSSIEIVETCEPDGPYGNWKIRAFEKCAPRDCSWGWTRGEFDESGRLYATFSTFIAERTIRLDPLSLRARVEVLVNYRKPGRQDSRASYLLVKTVKR